MFVKAVFARMIVLAVGLAWMLPGNCAGEVVAQKPMRIVSLAPSVTEIIFSLGEQQQLVGVTEFCDFPAEAAAIAKIGSFQRPDLERIVALKPDLCIAAGGGSVRDTVETLKAFSVPVYVVDPRDLKTVMSTILDIGRMIGAEARATEVVSDMQARIERIRALAAKTQQRPGVFFQIGITPIVSVGTDTFIDELITVAGGRNLAHGPVPYPRFSREQVLSLKPDIIVITSMTQGGAFDSVREEWLGWKDLPAAANGRVFIIDSNLCDRPTRRLVTGLEVLAGFIHPELF